LRARELYNPTTEGFGNIKAIGDLVEDINRVDRKISAGTIIKGSKSDRAVMQEGWLEIMGRRTATSRSRYTALYKVIQDQFGPTGSNTTFNIPGYADVAPWYMVGGKYLGHTGGGAFAVVATYQPLVYCHSHSAIVKALNYMPIGVDWNPGFAITMSYDIRSKGVVTAITPNVDVNALYPAHVSRDFMSNVLQYGTFWDDSYGAVVVGEGSLLGANISADPLAVNAFVVTAQVVDIDPFNTYWIKT